MKLPAAAEIYMKMPAAMKMPATAGNFIYISWSQGDLIRHGQNGTTLKTGTLTITPSRTLIAGYL